MTPAQGPSELRIAIAGFGAIGGVLAARLDQGMPGLRLVAVSARDPERAWARMALARPVPVLPLAELCGRADVVVECAPAAVFREVAEPTIEAGRIFVPASVGQLLEHDDLVELAARTGARIIVPTGALLGLDAVRAAAEGAIHSVTMVTRKPPRGLAGAPYLEQHGITLDGLSTSREKCSRAVLARVRAAFPPTSTSRLRSASPASARTARGSRSGPTRAWCATPIASSSRPTPRASR